MALPNLPRARFMRPPDGADLRAPRTPVIALRQVRPRTRHGGATDVRHAAFRLVAVFPLLRSRGGLIGGGPYPPAGPACPLAVACGGGVLTGAPAHSATCPGGC